MESQIFNILEAGAFIFGLTAIFKKNGVPSMYLPYISILLGGVIYGAFYMTINPQIILQGFFVGLVTTGMVAGVDDRAAKLATPIINEGTPKEADV